jgi:hypothetical protein
MFSVFFCLPGVIEMLPSEYCYNYEMQRAIEKSEAGIARVIPILLRPTNWQSSPFASLQGLPKDLNPVTQWEDQDLAFLDIIKGIRGACQMIINHR